MENKGNSSRFECVFLWFIENYSYCWHKNGEYLISPEFSADGLDGTRWTIKLYPRGESGDEKAYISIFLNRNETDDNPLNFSLSYELSFLNKDGFSIPLHFEHIFEKGQGYGPPKFIKIDAIPILDLPQDTLCVRFKIWKGEGKVQQVSQISARTRIGIEEITFLHITENLNLLEPNKKKTIEVKDPLKKYCVVSSTLYLNEDSKIIVKITPTIASYILKKCNIFLLHVSGKKIKCGEADNKFDTTGKGIQNLHLSLTKKEILNRKLDYLENDKLFLSCECFFSTGIDYEKIERISQEKPNVAAYQLMNDVKINDINNAAQKLSICPSALDDLKAIYDDQFLPDIELKTKTKSFPAHKILLCSRSSVFKTMLTTDMKEKINNSIQVNDLEDDTVEKLLVFLYSDKLGNLQWESAVKLYYAGDKYDIKRLKLECSSFLIDNVTTSSAIELLILADTHSDLDLKKTVEDFIFENEEQVFGSEEWEKLTESHSQLASKTMLLKYKKKNQEFNLSSS